jgi:hypothetical protein
VSSRRRFLSAAALGTAGLVLRPAAARGQAPVFPARAVPRVNGGINVQPARLLDVAPETPGLDPQVVDAQLATVYALGFEQARVTISWNRFGNDFFAAIPYVRALRALGVDVTAVLSQFAGFEFAQALSQPAVRNPLLRAYVDIFAAQVAPAPGVLRAGNIAFQLLNEPTHSLGIAPGVYLSRLLAPIYRLLKDDAPDLTVVSAAEVGTPEGVVRLRALFSAGLESSCDEVGYHVYDSRIVPMLEGLATKPVRVTESGADSTDRHRAWVETVFPALRRSIAGLREIHYFVLYDTLPGRHRLVDLARDADGSVRVVPESTDLLDLYAARVREAAAGATLAAYRDVIPDLGPYLPTEEDVAITRSVPPLVLP